MILAPVLLSLRRCMTLASVDNHARLGRMSPATSNDLRGGSCCMEFGWLLQRLPIGVALVLISTSLLDNTGALQPLCRVQSSIANSVRRRSYVVDFVVSNQQLTTVNCQWVSCSVRAGKILYHAGIDCRPPNLVETSCSYSAGLCIVRTFQARRLLLVPAITNSPG